MPCGLKTRFDPYRRFGPIDLATGVPYIRGEEVAMTFGFIAANYLAENAGRHDIVAS